MPCPHDTRGPRARGLAQRAITAMTASSPSPIRKKSTIHQFSVNIAFMFEVPARYDFACCGISIRLNCSFVRLLIIFTSSPFLRSGGEEHSRDLQPATPRTAARQWLPRPARGSRPENVANLGRSARRNATGEGGGLKGAGRTVL